MADILKPQTEPESRDVVQRYKDMGDGTHALVVAAVDAGGSGGDSVDRELSVITYRAKNAFTGASVGDTITATRVLDVSGEGATQVGSTMWRNESTDADLASAPAAADLESAGAVGLTDAQLRAAAVAVSAASLPLPTGAATAALQTTISNKLATLVDGKTPVDINKRITETNRSGTITTGGTAQQLAAANANRNGFWIQNLSEGDLYINTLGTATGQQPDLWIPSGALYEFPAHAVPTTAISIIGATTGQAFSAREW